MDPLKAWKEFEKTGSVASYLDYVTVQSASPLYGGQTGDETVDRRIDHQGKQLRG